MHAKAVILLDAFVGVFAHLVGPLAVLALEEEALACVRGAVGEGKSAVNTGQDQSQDPDYKSLFHNDSLINWGRPCKRPRVRERRSLQRPGIASENCLRGGSYALIL